MSNPQSGDASISISMRASPVSRRDKDTAFRVRHLPIETRAKGHRQDGAGTPTNATHLRPRLIAEAHGHLRRPASSAYWAEAGLCRMSRRGSSLRNAPIFGGAAGYREAFTSTLLRGPWCSVLTRKSQIQALEPNATGPCPFKGSGPRRDDDPCITNARSQPRFYAALNVKIRHVIIDCMHRPPRQRVPGKFLRQNRTRRSPRGAMCIWCSTTFRQPHKTPR